MTRIHRNEDGTWNLEVDHLGIVVRNESYGVVSAIADAYMRPHRWHSDRPETVEIAESIARTADATRHLVRAQVRMEYDRRTLLGDVKGFRVVDGRTLLDVRHFNGEPWPIEPDAGAVEVI